MSFLLSFVSFVSCVVLRVVSCVCFPACLCRVCVCVVSCLQHVPPCLDGPLARPGRTPVLRAVARGIVSRVGTRAFADGWVSAVGPQDVSR